MPFYKHDFPQNAFIEPVKNRPYDVVGLVRTKVDYPTLDPKHEEQELCKNYYNQAVRDLVKMAHDKGADAVIDVKSVVFYEGSDKPELHKTPECSDEGDEGQILTQGLAVKWKPIPSPSPSLKPKLR